ncbi:MAG: hypothetical protein HYY24_21375 [Verrucomicrobia bacterium]|nr:hypothetical protein [Verrucomicrobiota bacterium]
MNKLLGILVSATLALTAHAAPFQNLSFDEGATIRVGADGYGPIADLLPGWSLSIPAGPLSEIGYNSAPLGDGWVSLIPKDNFGGFPPYPVFGLYSLAVDPVVRFSSLSPMTLSQRADVPADAVTINFINYGSPFELRLNGTPISLTYQDADPSLFPGRGLRYASGDVSAFAGQNVELTFSAFYAEGIPSIHGLDSISFVVREPSTWLLLGLGGLVLLAPRSGRAAG